MFVDTHCHLFKEYYDDIDEVIKEAKQQNVSYYISAADSISSCYEMLECTKKYDNVYIAIGIHPENCFDDINELKKILEENKQNKKIVAIGEIGLDYYYGKENRDKQIEIFDYQLSLAEEYNLPVVVHSREATLDTLNIIKKHKVRGVIHSFSGSHETAKEYIKLNFSFGVNGIITFKNTKLGEVIKEIPLENLLLETDSPYLSPEPFRGKKNSPKNVVLIAKKIAEIKNTDLENVMKKTTQNAHDIFDI